MRPILGDPSASVKDAAFTLVTRGVRLHGQSTRTARWTDGATELYDHNTDPAELHDVSAQHADITAELTAQIRKLPPLTSKP